MIDIFTGTGSVSKVKFYCEYSNAHAQTLQAQPHSASSSAVLTLPIATGTLIGTGDSGTVSNAMLANKTVTISDDSSTAVSVPLGGGFTILGGSGITTALNGSEMTIATDGAVVTETSTDTLTNKSIDSDNNTITNLVNADIKSSAAIAFSKMENLTTARALVSDGSGDVSVSDVTSTEIGHLDGVSSNIQTQLDTKAATSFAIAQAVALG